MITEDLYKKACLAIDEVHAKDANIELVDGVEMAAELIYSQRMLKVLTEFLVDADYKISLAAQCQHFERWAVARSLYPMDKKGYFQWRKAIMEYQLKRTSEVLASCGIALNDIEGIRDVLQNRGKKDHVQGQVIEDVACIVFVEWYLAAFAAKHEQDKVIGIVKKTVKKISEEGMKAISTRPLSGTVQEILKHI
jgi:hypothetical protein